MCIRDRYQRRVRGRPDLKMEASGETETLVPWETGERFAENELCPRMVLDGSADAFSLSFSPDNVMIAAACGDGAVRVFHSGSGKLLYTLGGDFNTDPGVKGAKLPATCVKFRPNTSFSKTKNVLLVGNCEGQIEHWHVTSQKKLNTITETSNQVFSLDYHPEGTNFVSVGSDAQVRIYDEATKTQVSTMASGWGAPAPGHSNRVFCVKYVPEDPNMIISTGWDNTIQFWDVRLNYSVRSILGPHVCGDAMDVVNGQVLTCSWQPENQIEKWDLGTGKKMCGYTMARDSQGNVPMLYGGQFSKGPNRGQMFASAASGTNEGNLWNTETLECLGSTGQTNNSLFACEFASDSSMVAFGGSETSIVLYDVSA
eukprot:TRINITY_DN1673_c0_g1_i3.p1 TRINITY_DN1673_c0_g1~~TRINITY_DN1673_c0_g1_i3.p1  ORF type:complete len:370 (-),score=86.71 TRINITY_DN1673_c0_g1_i3:136-1245(-)